MNQTHWFGSITKEREEIHKIGCLSQTMSSGGGGTSEVHSKFYKKKHNSEVWRFKVLGSLWKRAKSIQDLFLPTSCTAKYLSAPSELGDRTIQS